MDVLQQPGPDSLYGTVPWALRSNDLSLFMVFIYIWQENVAKILQVPGASGQ